MDFHRHDEFSLFDGFGKASYAAKVAKELGYRSLGLTNHGNTSGLIEHYFSCEEQGIKPIMGVEAYFQPKFDKEKRTFHLCLFAKTTEGYSNLMKIMSDANTENFYKKAIVTLKELEKYKDGIVCSSACIAGIIPQMLMDSEGVPKKSNIKRAMIFAKKFKEIFGDDFYIEIQPFKVDNKRTQEKLNVMLTKIAKDLDIKVIATTDSHYCKEDDFDTYVLMHHMARSNSSIDVEETYAGRYMRSEDDLFHKLEKMHGASCKYKSHVPLDSIIDDMYTFEDSFEDGILKPLVERDKIPQMHKDSSKIMQRELTKGLKKKGRYDKAHMSKVKKEFEVLSEHGFEDYFLIVQDYVKWAKDKGILVGPGRGSVCNSNIAYALDITDVDPVYFNLDFRRFLRMDKKKLPDIDLDFESERRQEVIDYLIEKYEGKAVQIGSYGLYKVDNLCNDLAKVLEVEEEELKWIKKRINKIKGESDSLTFEDLMEFKDVKEFNEENGDFIKHFSKLYKQVRYFGKHAAGVVIVDDDITNYTSIMYHGGMYKSCYDLNNLDQLNVVKFDILGLSTMSKIRDLRKMTGEEFSYEMLENQDVLDAFKEGETDAIFQFEKNTAKNILKLMHADCIEDVIAASSLNRPAPLGLKMHEQYAHNKLENQEKDTAYYKYTEDTYGTIIYQEQVMSICRKIGKLPWSDTDKVMKMMKGSSVTEAFWRRVKEDYDRIEKEFVKNAKTKMTKEEAEKLFDDITKYLFNKGHSTGYALLSIEQMFYKVFYNTEFWAASINNESMDSKVWQYKAASIKDGNILLLPHVNGGTFTKVVDIGNEKAIQLGLSTIKGVGVKAAEAIEKELEENGEFTDLADFEYRMEPHKRAVNSGVIKKLLEDGALEFDESIYEEAVYKYNKANFARA